MEKSLKDMSVEELVALAEKLRNGSPEINYGPGAMDLYEAKAVLAVTGGEWSLQIAQNLPERMVAACRMEAYERGYCYFMTGETLADSLAFYEKADKKMRGTVVRNFNQTKMYPSPKMDDVVSAMLQFLEFLTEVAEDERQPRGLLEVALRDNWVAGRLQMIFGWNGIVLAPDESIRFENIGAGEAKNLGIASTTSTT